MQAELNSEVALSAANALLSHLRRNPEAAMTPARDLAATFGLDEAFVAQVLQGIHANRKPEVRQQTARQSPIRTVAFGIRSVWLKATSRPLLFIGISLVACVALIVGVIVLVPRVVPASRVADTDFSSRSLIILLSGFIVVTLTFLAHLGVYFRHRSARDALYGALIVFVSLCTVLGLLFLFGSPRSEPRDQSPALLFMVGMTGMLMIALMYAGVGSLAAVLGGWSRMKQQDRAEETMSRQDLLERYFELQSRLQMTAYPRPSGQVAAIFNSPLVASYRKFQLLVNAGVGLCISMLTLITVKASGMSPTSNQPPSQISVWFFVVMFLGLTDFLYYIVQGYLSQSALRAILGSVAVWAGSLLAKLVPLQDAQVGRFGVAGQIAAESVSMLLMIGVSCAGYLGAVVQNRAIRESKLQRNDQATLLAEMVRIQWKLSNETAAVCVMVVDAARSSEMKADADPLAVEYTFREYQEWIEKISMERGGRIHSTAGDGAVVAFDTCALALSAARRIQTDLFQFNRDVNRLTLPFRLRVGLHTGEVVGDINEVQFTEVIDIAAHIEGACPVGGIAATDEVVHRLPDEQFVDLATVIDGHQVYIVAKPTEFQ